MTESNWERLGRLLKERRLQINAPTRSKFATDKGFRNDRVLAALENAERTNFDPSTLTQVEIAYGWTIGSIGDVLAGGEPTIASETPITEARPANFSDYIQEKADEARARFELAVAELVAAEAAVDSADRAVFAHLEFQNKFLVELARRETEAGRKLTPAERMLIDGVDRPTPEEVATSTAYYATNDPHEWTRYEMALVEAIFPEWTDITNGSRYADLSQARQRVARMTLQAVSFQAGEGGDTNGSTNEEEEAQKIADRLRQEQLRLAAKQGSKEPDDEDQ